MTRRFWFPGFTPRTGGLLRERGLFAARDAFARDAGTRSRLLGVARRFPRPPPARLRVSLFCYPNPALPALLDAWAEATIR